MKDDNFEEKVDEELTGIYEGPKYELSQLKRQYEHLEALYDQEVDDMKELLCENRQLKNVIVKLAIKLEGDD